MNEKLLADCERYDTRADRDGVYVSEQGPRPSKKASPPSAPSHEIRVLLVSPEAADLRTALSYGLQMSGCILNTSLEASDALHSMKCAATTGAPFHAVIADERLVGIDARLFACLVSEEKGLPPTPLLLLCDSNDNGFGEFATAGYAAALVRPVDAADMSYRLRSIARTDLPFSPVQDPLPTKPRTGEQAKHRILLVEDNTINMEVAHEMLAQFGYRCDKALDGHEAVAAARRLHYDLILMDCQMPGMDGYEATRRIRVLEETLAEPSQTPIVAVTAHAMKGDRERCLACGMNDYMTKPVGSTQLAAMVTKWLKPMRSYSEKEADDE